MEVINYIFNNSIFIKSTSRHVTDGVLLTQNFQLDKKDIKNKKLQNLNIYKNILNHFKN